MASLLVINVVVEVFLQMTRCYMLQQDLNFKKLFKILPVGGLEIMKMQFCINKMCLFFVVRGIEFSRFLNNNIPPPLIFQVKSYLKGIAIPT